MQNDLVFVFEKFFRLLRNDRREFLAERLLDGTVELQGFGDGHLVDFAADDAQRGAAEHVDDVARARARTAPVVRLDDDKRALASLFILGADDVVDDILFVFDEIGDDFEAFDAAVDVRRGEDRGFEVEQGAVAVEDEVAVSVADRVAVDVVAAVLGVRELADDFIEFAAGVFSAEEEEKEAFAASVFERREVVDDVVGENFRGEFVARPDAALEGFGVCFGERLVRRDHACGDEFKSGSGEQACNDAAGSGFFQRVGCNQHIRKFHCHFLSSFS